MILQLQVQTATVRRCIAVALTACSHLLASTNITSKLLIERITVAELRI
jgi:hypothetical protein